MTQTVLSKGKRALLEGQQFDPDAMRVGDYRVTDLRDAYTSRSEPGNLIRAKNYLTVTIDVSEPQDGSRTVEWLACLLCNQVRPTVAAVEAHITSDHANGARRAGAGDVAELATAGDRVQEAGAVPAQREPEPVPEPEVVEERVPERPKESEAFMKEARATRKRYRDLQRAHEREHGKPMPKAEAARRLGIHRTTLDRRLEATEHLARKTYNTMTPQETQAAYDELVAESGPLTLAEAAERLGMSPQTLSKRLREAEPTGEDVAGTDPQAEAPAEEEPAAVEEEGPGVEEDDVLLDAVYDPSGEDRLTTNVELVVQLSDSRNYWKTLAEDRAVLVTQWRDRALAAEAALDNARSALGIKG